MSGKANYPTAQLDAIGKPDIKQTVADLRQLHDMGKPQTDAEVEERIELYFNHCEESSLRPGIESLCLALHVTRQTLFRWNSGEGCSPYRQEIVQSAKAFISAFIEQASLSGKVNPATSIFLLKNWCGYRDNFTSGDCVEAKTSVPVVPFEEIAKRRGIQLEIPKKPEL